MLTLVGGVAVIVLVVIIGLVLALLIVAIVIIALIAGVLVILLPIVLMVLGIVLFVAGIAVQIVTSVGIVSFLAIFNFMASPFYLSVLSWAVMMPFVIIYGPFHLFYEQVYKIYIFAPNGVNGAEAHASSYLSNPGFALDF